MQHNIMTETTTKRGGKFRVGDNWSSTVNCKNREKERVESIIHDNTQFFKHIFFVFNNLQGLKDNSV